jgi:hypothetical protein
MTAHHWQRITRGIALSLFCVPVVACSVGGEDEDGGGSTVLDLGDMPGTITPEYSAYCAARFTEDHDVVDVFSDRLFTAKAGEEYLMASYGSTEASLVYLTEGGPLEFEVPALGGEYPFESDCEPGNMVDYLAALTSVDVYSSEAFDVLLCSLDGGSVLPRDPTVQSGYSALDFAFSGPSTYQVYLNAFAAQCGDVEIGYISVPEVLLFGTTTWLVPVIGIIGPG